MLENDRVKFTIDVESQQWKDALNEAYLKTKGKYNIDGFRKGHAPRAFIERFYGPSVFFDEALDIILPKTYDAVLDAEPDLFPVDRPEVSITAITDSTLQYTAEVQLKPTVTLGAYTGIEFAKDKVKVSKDEVEEEINRARESAGWWDQVTDRPAQMGDKGKIDYALVEKVLEKNDLKQKNVLLMTVTGGENFYLQPKSGRYITGRLEEENAG